MVRDYTKFKVLMAAGKGLTPTQQAWDPRTLETHAQLGVKRAAVSILGQIRALLWTVHANAKRLLSAVDIDVKHLRWISEIVADGSTINSLSRRSAVLGDGFREILRIGMRLLKTCRELRVSAGHSISRSSVQTGSRPMVNLFRGRCRGIRNQFHRLTPCRPTAATWRIRI